jgi:hypothetical protein
VVSGIDGGREGVEFQKVVQGAVELAVEAGFFVSVLGFEGRGIHETAGGRGALLAFPEAELTPVGGGHFADEEILDGGCGLEVVGERVDEAEEAAAGFVSADDGSGERFVVGGGGVVGGPGAFGAAGAGSIGAGGGDLFFGSWFLHLIGLLVGDLAWGFGVGGEEVE